ncbi:hypothetical protein [Teredinibacter franksiae]|uniref:hypothetical protein n=1 Tax=Teredinibacter franksiae TaxID=2761453 RepID=UPI0016257AC8|nr:hypothetical protein [Teredinibacter franksiae]
MNTHIFFTCARPLLGIGLLFLALLTNAANDPSACTKTPTSPEGFLDQHQKTITIIIPRGEGGGSHQLSAKMREAMLPYLPEGTNITLQHITGDNGLEAIRQFYLLPENGYTLLQHVDDVAPYIHMHEGHKTIDKSRLKPLAIVQRTYSQLFIRNYVEQRFTNWPEFVTYASNNPVKVAVVGHKGSMEDLYIDELNTQYGLRIEDQAINNPSERYMAIIQDKADLLIEQPGDVSVFIDRKLFKPIISLPVQPNDTIEGAPSLKEFIEKGMPTLERFRGFFVHSGVEQPRYDYLHEVLSCAYRSKTYQAFNKANKMAPDSYLDGAGAAKFIDSSIQYYISLTDSNGSLLHHADAH